MPENAPTNKMNLPILSADPQDVMINNMMKRYPYMGYRRISALINMPEADDYEAILHYLRNVAGPIIDMKLYVDLGVGFYCSPSGFENDEDGQDAKELVEEKFKQMEMQESILMLGAFFEVLGRLCGVRTFNLNGGFYFNATEKCNGFEVVNPMTLDIMSIKEALTDRTGTKVFKQVGFTATGKSETVEFTQDRVVYKTMNPLSKFSPYGNSDIQKSVTDLRLLSEFPYFRRKLARKYTELFRVISVDYEKVTQGEAGQLLANDFGAAQKMLDEIATFYRDQEH